MMQDWFVCVCLPFGGGGCRLRSVEAWVVVRSKSWWKVEGSREDWRKVVVGFLLPRYPGNGQVPGKVLGRVLPWMDW